MLYTDEIKEKLSGINSSLVKVIIDGEDVGILPKIDVLEQINRPKNWGRKRIGEIIIRDKVNKVGRNIDLKPATTDELFAAAVGSSVAKGETNIVVDGCMENAKKVINEKEISEIDEYVDRLRQALIRNGGRVIESKRSQNPSAVKSKKSRGVSSKVGLFARIKAWLKGDKGYKK